MLSVLLLVCNLSGYFFFAKRAFQMPAAVTPLFGISFVIIMMFLGFIWQQPQVIYSTLSYFGIGLGIISFIYPTDFDDKREYLIYWGLVLLSFCYAYAMTFSAIDSYVYWGLIGKYLYVTDSLPTLQSGFVPRHLSYTPGLGGWQYFIFQVFHSDNVRFAFLAQNLLLLASIFAVATDRCWRQKWASLCVLILCLAIFRGSVFAKMQVETILIVAAFIGCWYVLIFGDKIATYLLLVLLCPLLFLIKQIGLALALLIIVFAAVNLLRNRKHSAWVVLAVALAVLLVIKIVWSYYWHSVGIHSFVNAVTIESLTAALKTHQAWHQIGQFMYALTLGPADRLHIPFFIYSLAMFYMGRQIKKSAIDSRDAFMLFRRVAWPFFAVYAILLLAMQLVVFPGYDHLIGVMRYLQIFSLPIFFCYLFTYLRTTNYAENKHVFRGLIIVVVLISIIGYKHRLKENEPGNNWQKLSVLAKNLKPSQQDICIDVKPESLLGLRFYYFTTPRKLKYVPPGQASSCDNYIQLLLLAKN